MAQKWCEGFLGHGCGEPIVGVWGVKGCSGRRGGFRDFRAELGALLLGLDWDPQGF